MKRSRLFAALAIALALAGACKSEYDALLQSSDSEAKYKAAFKYFNEGKYNRAAELFESLSVLTSGTARDDTVQYYWALSNYSNSDFGTAETNFSNFLQNFPLSPFADQAEFLHLDCLFKSTLRYELDQTPTYSAISAISTYLAKHPSGANADVCRGMVRDLNERLDRKAFENARIYYTMEDYKASRVAFKNILKEDADNIYREDILYYSAMSSYKYADLSVSARQKERFLVFEDDYLNFIGEYPESKHRKELDALNKKVKNK